MRKFAWVLSPFAGLPARAQGQPAPEAATGGVPWWVWLIVAIAVALLGYYLFKRRGRKGEGK